MGFIQAMQNATHYVAKDNETGDLYIAPITAGEKLPKGARKFATKEAAHAFVLRAVAGL